MLKTSCMISTMSVKRSSYWLEQTVSQSYAKFRPKQPESIATAVIEFLLQNNSRIEQQRQQTGKAARRIVDVGCGTGHSTQIWAAHCQQVIGVDISESQIEMAQQECSAENIEYHVASYDDLSSVVNDSSCDVVTCCQAVHWFELDKFYAEVDRVLVPGGVLALTLYQTPTIGTTDMQQTFMTFYQRLWDTGCWDERRRWIETCYQDVKLPYEEQIIRRNDAEFQCVTSMTLSQLAGYWSTISAVKVYKQKYGAEKYEELMKNFYTSLHDSLERSHGGEESEAAFDVIFPYSLMMCRKEPI